MDKSYPVMQKAQRGAGYEDLEAFCAVVVVAHPDLFTALSDAMLGPCQVLTKGRIYIGLPSPLVSQPVKIRVDRAGVMYVSTPKCPNALFNLFRRLPAVFNFYLLYCHLEILYGLGWMNRTFIRLLVG